MLERGSATLYDNKQLHWGLNTNLFHQLHAAQVQHSGEGESLIGSIGYHQRVLADYRAKTGQAAGAWLFAPSPQPMSAPNGFIMTKSSLLRSVSAWDVQLCRCLASIDQCGSGMESEMPTFGGLGTRGNDRASPVNCTAGSEDMLPFVIIIIV